MFFWKQKYYFLVQTTFRTIYLLFIVIRAPNRAPATGAQRRAPESRPARDYPEIKLIETQVRNQRIQKIFKPRERAESELFRELSLKFLADS